MIEIILALIILAIILFLFFKFNKKDKKVKIKPAVSNEENDREVFNKKYAKQFRALGRKKIKIQENLKSFIQKWLVKKKKKNLIN